MKDAYVYMITNWTNEVIYTGVTNNLERRILEHRSKATPGFSKTYNLAKLVYYEQTSDMMAAIDREKKIKGLRREKKDRLVNKMNPDWIDLSAGWYEDSSVGVAVVRNDAVGVL